MHPLMLGKVITCCKQRIADGDCPTVKAFSVEQLEDAVVQLERELAAAREEVRVLREANDTFARHAIAETAARKEGR